MLGQSIEKLCVNEGAALQRPLRAEQAPDESGLLPGQIDFLRALDNFHTDDVFRIEDFA